MYDIVRVSRAFFFFFRSAALNRATALDRGVELLKTIFFRTSAAAAAAAIPFYVHIKQRGDSCLGKPRPSESFSSLVWKQSFSRTRTARAYSNVRAVLKTWPSDYLKQDTSCLLYTGRSTICDAGRLPTRVHRLLPGQTNGNIYKTA